MPGMNWNDLLRTGLNGHRYPPLPPENNIIMSLCCTCVLGLPLFLLHCGFQKKNFLFVFQVNSVMPILVPSLHRNELNACL